MLASSVIYVAPAAAVEVAYPRVELTDKRTVYSKTYDNRDGTYTYESYLEPVHYMDSAKGMWEEIDQSLVETTTPRGAGYANRANSFSVFLPQSAASQPVCIGGDGVSIEMTPVGRPLELGVQPTAAQTSTPLPMRSNARKYAGVFGDADVVYESVARGLKETIVLERPTGRTTFSFDMLCMGVEPSLDGSGCVVFTSTSTGAVAYRMVPPFMVDSSQDEAGEAAYSNLVHYELRRTGLNWRLDVVADKDWLKDPARVYPVKIDPTTYVDYATERWLECADAYVTSAYPNNNYGYSTELKVGQISSLGTGINRTYVQPYLGGLVGQNLTVLDAKLGLYCYWRYDHTAKRVNCAYANTAWSEGGITWNNKPAATYMNYANVAENAWAYWDLTGYVREVVLGIRQDYGVMLYAYSETDANYWTKFYSLDSSDSRYPLMTVKYTSEPEISLEAPGPEVPVSSSASTIRARWTYEDAMGKTQGKVQLQVASGLDPLTIVKDTGAIETSETAVDIAAPTGGWTEDRYWIRMRVWGVTPELPGAIATSNWTAWQPFDRKVLTSSNDGAGLLPYRATDAIGAGLSVDLASGVLVGARTDVAFSGLGGPLTYGAVYDSDVTADTGLGKGWTMASPSLVFDDQRAPNPGFEQTPLSGDNPPGWAIDTADDALLSASTAAKRTGTYGLRFYYSSSTSYANVWVATGSGTSNDLPVHPGERLTASSWVKTVSMACNTSQTEYGALMKVHFFDGAGTYLSTVVSPNFEVATTSEWVPLTMEMVAPAGAYYARMNLEMRNARGTIYFDDVALRDRTVDFTDAAGTGRTLDAVGGGIYGRDPLDPGAALTEANVTAGAKGATSSGTKLTYSLDGAVSERSGLFYDGVTANWDGSAYFQYELSSAQVLSRIRMRFWDLAETTPRTYTYRVETSVDGSNWEEVVSQTTGRSWVTHDIDPVRAKYVRVIALNNSANSGFHIAELELPQLRLGDTVACFDEDGALIAAGDLSGNGVSYSYDASGHLTGCDDGLGAAATGRGIDLVWYSGKLASVDFTGVASNGTSQTDYDYAQFSEVASGTGTAYSITRNDDTSDIDVVTYHYNSSGRIDGAYDADGVGLSIAYDGSGRVSTVTLSGDPTPTVTTYTYGSGKTTMATTGGGLSSPVTEVTYSSSLGCQATQVKLIDPTGDDPVTTYTYDQYGQVWKVTDPLGNVARTETDGRGNVLVSADEDGSGNTLRESRAAYDRDHVVRTEDETRNASEYSYDDSWRLLSAAQVVSETLSEGSVVSRQTYDGYGNLITQALPSSTSYNLLRNGTFERDPFTSGNGWGGPRQGDMFVSEDSQQYLGRSVLVLCDYDVAPYITSDEIAVRSDRTYTLSAWVQEWGTVQVLEYNSSHQLLATIDALQTASYSTACRRTSVTYAPSTSSVTYVRIRPTRPVDGSFCVDSIRFEAANVASADSFVENESMEQVASNLPKSWLRRSTSYTTAIHEASSSESVAGGFSAHIKHSETSALGYFRSDLIGVNPGETYTVSTFMKTVDSVGGARSYIRFYDANKTDQTSLDTAIAPITYGTTDWTRYAVQVEIPAEARYLSVYLNFSAGGGDAYWDAVSVTPQSGLSTAEYDDATHTYAVETTSITGLETDMDYDARGRATDVSVTPAGESVAIDMRSADYDGLDRLTTVESLPGSGLGIDAQFTYSDAGRLESITDPLAHTTTIGYDTAGRTTGVTSELDIRTLLSYDPLGRLSEVMAPTQGSQPTTVTSSITYDSLGRVGSTAYCDPSDGSVFATRTVAYDLASRVTGETLVGQVSGSIASTYDELDRVTSRNTAGPAGSFEQDVNYNVSSQPTQIDYTALGASWSITNTYAKTKQLLSRTAADETWDFSFSAAGQLSSVKSGISLQTRSFDVYGRLESVRDGKTSDGQYKNVLEAVLSYDLRGRISAQQTDGDTFFYDSTDTFSYDDANRLTGWQRSGTGATSAMYSYDAACNITTATVSGTTTGYTYDADNRLVSSVVGGQTMTYTNDLYGRRTAEISGEATTTYSWDALGHLTQIVSEDTTITYEYGITGMREYKSVETSGAATTWTKSVWDGQQLVAELDSDGVRYTYVWGPDRLPLAVQVTEPGEASVTYAYHTDGLGNVVALTETTSVLPVASYRYDPYGRVTYVGGSDPAIAERNPLRYRSYYYDAETGFYYLPARYYDPDTMRFLSQDPAPPSAGDPLSLNAYVYCVGDPVNRYDPDGAYDIFKETEARDARNYEANRLSDEKFYQDNPTRCGTDNPVYRQAAQTARDWRDGKARPADNRAGPAPTRTSAEPAGEPYGGYAADRYEAADLVHDLCGPEIGLIVWGAAFIYGGLAIMAGGTAASATAVGGLVGVPAFIVGLQFMCSGVVMIGAGTKSLGLW